MMNSTSRVVARAAAIFMLVAAGANAAPITDGFTFAVASLGGSQGSGDHFHSSTGGAFGNPAGIAEVGNFGTEEVRGLSEYNLAGLSAAIAAYVTFDTVGFGLFPGTNDFPFDGVIDIVAYQGNNAEDVSDYQAPAVASIGSFNTTGLTAGTVFSFDILSVFNNAVSNSWSSLGIRLSTEDTSDFGGAWSFNDFRLTTTNESTAVPEPGLLLLLSTGLLGLALSRRRRQA